MNVEDVVAGWRGLSLAVSERLGRPIGVGQVRWQVELSGLPIGRKIGNSLVFDESDIDTVVRLVQGRRP